MASQKVQKALFPSFRQTPIKSGAGVGIQVFHTLTKYLDSGCHRSDDFKERIRMK